MSMQTMSIQTLSKRLKYIFAVLLSLAVLGGCREEMPSLGTASSEETSESTGASADVTTAVPATEKTETETSSQTEVSETVSEVDKISEEQAALEKLIADTAGNTEGYSVHSLLFEDIDGDGVNELVAVFGEHKDVVLATGGTINGSIGEVWFASGNKAYKLAGSQLWGKPYVRVSMERTILNLPNVYVSAIGGSDEYTYSFRIKNSEAKEIKNADPHGLWIDGAYGDFTTSQMAMDGGMFEGHFSMGRTWKIYWCYYLDDKISEYYGKEITEEEFLKYDGAQTILNEINADGRTVNNILKRGNGLINLNYSQKDEKYDEEYFDNITLFYRNGKVMEKENGNGIYNPCFADYEKEKQTDFERFSEMIYDTAEGDENSFIRERFYGNIDGKNALYAYYGTDENFSLWYADKDGAKKVTEDISLFYADGDALMRNGGDYFVMKNGKPQKLDTMGAEDLTMLPDGSFTGIVKSGYSDSQKTEETKKPYWFRYRDGAFRDCIGVDITEEELLQYGGGRAALDEVAARGGDLVNIVRRENGIININYALHNQTTTKRFFMTLEIDDDNKLTDITPKKEDGTPDNAGWYLHSLEIRG